MGIIGGMGPEATIDLQAQILAVDKEKNSPARDQDFRPYAVLMKTGIPDRTGYLMRCPGAENPVPKMKEAIDDLAKLGVTHFAMPCNTAHAFLPELEGYIKERGHSMTPVHIVDATMAQVPEDARKVAVMATDGTLGFELYQRRGNEYRSRMNQEPVEWLVPAGSQAYPASDQGRVMHAIYGCIKNQEGTDAQRAARLSEAGGLFRDVAQKLADNGADAILLACTEIPIGLKDPHIVRSDGTRVPLISTTKALAIAFVEKAQEAGIPAASSPATLAAARKAVDAHVRQDA